MIVQEDLAHAGCGTPGCGHDHSSLFMHGKCHTHAPVQACYEKASGSLTLTCHRCGEHVATFLIAKRRHASLEAQN